MPLRRVGVPTIPFLCIALLPCVAYAGWIWSRFPDEVFTPNGALVVRDYLNVWAGGRLAAAGRTDIVFDPRAYQAWLEGVFGPALDLHTWSYPPHVLLLAVPFASLPLLPGFAAWTAATLAFLGVVLRSAGLAPPAALAVVLSPAAVDNALAGQNGALTAAALAGGLLLAGRKPMAAGALLGLLTTKPQLGVLVPVCLLASRDWRGLAWTAAFGAFYATASLPFFGFEAWERYFSGTAPFMRSVMEAPFGLAFQLAMPTPFISARAAGAGLSAAYAVQAVAALACFAAAAWAWDRRRPPGARPAAVALALLLTPLATPYAHAYDLVAAAAALAILAQRDTLTRPEFYVLGGAWIWPGLAFLVGASACPGFGPLFLAAAAVCAAVRVRRAAAVAAATGSKAFARPSPSPV